MEAISKSQFFAAATPWVRFQLRPRTISGNYLAPTQKGTEFSELPGDVCNTRAWHWHKQRMNTSSSFYCISESQSGWCQISGGHLVQTPCSSRATLTSLETPRNHVQHNLSQKSFLCSKEDTSAVLKCILTQNWHSVTYLEEQMWS